jgi:hypothetical protein
MPEGRHVPPPSLEPSPTSGELEPKLQKDADRQAMLLALAILSLDRPGWLEYLRGVAREYFDHDGVPVFEELRRLNADRWVADPFAVELRDSEPLLQFFVYKHLPAALQEHSEPFARLAVGIVNRTERNPERTVSVRKLLESKDCAVRAQLWRNP